MLPLGSADCHAFAMRLAYIQKASSIPSSQNASHCNCEGLSIFNKDVRSGVPIWMYQPMRRRLANQTLDPNSPDNR